MKRIMLALAILGLVAFAAPRPADAGVSFFVGVPGFSVYSGPSVVYAPPVYAPPVYYPRPYYPPVFYGRPYPVFYGPWGHGHGWHRGWYKHGHW